MTITQNGSTLTWNGTVTLTNATNITTGVATLMLTPAGGVGNLPVLAQGLPGPPPVIDSVSVTQIASSATPTAPVLTLVSAGGPGVASHYTLSFQVNQGAAGSTGSFQIQSATDLTAGSATVDYTLLVNTISPTTFKYAQQLVGDTYQCTSFTAASGNASPQILGSITVPSYNFNWRPRVTGMATPTGTANTHVDLICRLNNSSSGQQVGYAVGLTGAGSPGIPALPLTLDQAFGGAISGGYGTVTSGNAATFYFEAIQTAATTDNFSVPTTNMYFTVKVDPIPGTN